MSLHTDWLKKTNIKLQTADGKPVEVWEFNHTTDEAMLSQWASHFRQQYIADIYIDPSRDSLSRKNYLLNHIFPETGKGLKSAIRAGDFAEILVADFLEFLENYMVPRYRYDEKPTRNSSTQGSDVLAIKILNPDKVSKNDELLVVEVKANLSEGKKKNYLQVAVNHSSKDPKRSAEALNAIKRRWIKEKNEEGVKTITRFQNFDDNPYIASYGATAVLNTMHFYENEISSVSTEQHPNKDNLRLIVITGKDMMKLVHELYERAANEA